MQLLRYVTLSQLATCSLWDCSDFALPIKAEVAAYSCATRLEVQRAISVEIGGVKATTKPSASGSVQTGGCKGASSRRCRTLTTMCRLCLQIVFRYMPELFLKSLENKPCRGAKQQKKCCEECRRASILNSRRPRRLVHNSLLKPGQHVMARKSLAGVQLRNHQCCTLTNAP